MINILNKQYVLRRKPFKLLSEKNGNLKKIANFLKFIISVRRGHFNYSTFAPQNLATPLTACSRFPADFSMKLGSVLSTVNSNDPVKLHEVHGKCRGRRREAEYNQSFNRKLSREETPWETMVLRK
jgi:hypothetical protein